MMHSLHDASLEEATLNSEEIKPVVELHPVLYARLKAVSQLAEILLNTTSYTVINHRNLLEGFREWV